MTEQRTSIALDDSFRDSPELYRLLVQSVLDYAIFALDDTGHIANWNVGAAQIKGYTAEEIIGRHISVFYPPEDVAAGKPERLLAAAAAEGHVSDEGWRVRKDGGRFWASVVIAAIRGDGGELLGFTKVTRDLTERRHAEAELRRSEERFALLVRSVQDYAILMLDPTGHVVTWNEGAERIKGYRAEEILGHSFAEFYPPEVRASGFPERELELAAREGRFQNEGWRVRKDGSRFWANVLMTALRDEEGGLVGFAKVTGDLTVRREAEEAKVKLAAEAAALAEATRQKEALERLNQQLQDQTAELEMQAEELQAMAAQLEEANDELQSALGEAQAARSAAEHAAAVTETAYGELDQFAYVASHDLKAPLRGIANLAEWLREDLGDALPDESREHVRLLQGRVRRMEALIEGILAYSRAGRTRSAPGQVDSGAVVAGVIELLAPAPGVRIEVQPEMPVVEAESTPFEQVFMNLIGNALKYGLPGRSDLVVRIGWRDAGEAYEFEVSDNGPGIAPEFHERIWTMFQTLETRDDVEGTGIGLSVVRKIVETRGGHVWLRSAPGQGSTFIFSWPKLPLHEALP